jgi:hypothetical protein
MVVIAATIPNAKTDLLPPFEPSSMSAMAISLKAIKNREGAEGRDIKIL